MDFYGKAIVWLTRGVAQEAAMEKLAPFTCPVEDATPAGFEGSENKMDVSGKATVK